MTERKWVLRELDETLCNRLQAELGVHPLTAKLLANRGLDSADKVKSFLNKDEIPLHDPYLLKDMEAAVARIRRAIEKKERVCIYGDYDVDGVTSTMILYDYLTARGVQCEYFIPDRISEGYGLSLPVIQRMVGKVDMIITVDTGITAIDEARYAKEQGIDMVITDHHNCREIIPDAVAVVNPHREDCEYPFKNLAGVGVVFKVLCAVDGDTKRICDRYADVVAIGTIAEIVNAILGNGEPCGKLVTAVLAEEILAGGQRIHQREALDASARALGNVTVVGEQDAGLGELFCDLGSDDPDHALMPAFGAQDIEAIVLAELTDLFKCLLVDLLLHSLTELIGLAQFPCNTVCRLLVLGDQQFDRTGSGSNSACGVDTGCQNIAHGGGGDLLHLSAMLDDARMTHKGEDTGRTDRFSG